MLITIDVGNTQTTVGLFDQRDDQGADASPHIQWRMATDHTDTADELHERLFGYFQMHGLALDEVSHAAIASVVPILTTGWREFLNDLLEGEPLVIDASRDCGIEVAMPDPHSVGADRIANAVAARARYGAPAVVVDFGTATNIDVVDGRGRYRGGVIAPGLMLSAGALFSRAAKLSSVPLERPDHTLGDTTETAVQAGIVIGEAARAEGLVGRIKKELAAEGDADPVVIATGGLARLVSEATDLFDEVDPDLTLRGIRQIWLHAWEKHSRDRSVL
jgi:type III pantothenate kinase